MANKQSLQAAGDGTAVPAGYIGERITWTTPPTSANGITTTTESDWLNATFTIGAGVWLIHVSGNVVLVTGATSGNDVETFIKVTDNSSALIGTMVTSARLKAVANVQAVATFPYCIQEVYTTSAASTLLKLRIKRTDNAGTGNTSTFYNEANNYARFFAVRIA